MIEYSALDYYRGVYAGPAAADLLARRWQMAGQAGATGGIKCSVDHPVDAMDVGSYELLAYARSALFFNAVQEQLGDERYRSVLRAYEDACRWKIATPQQFFRLAQSVSGVSLDALAETWLR